MNVGKNICRYTRIYKFVFFSREACVKTEQKNSMQRGRGGGGEPVQIGSLGTEPNWQVLPGGLLEIWQMLS
jgi:hypothetical protein